MSRRPARPPAPGRRTVASVLLLGAALTGCTGPAPGAPPTAPPAPLPSAASPASTAAQPEEAPPSLVPGGAAGENLPFFTHVTHQVWAGPDRVSGRAYVDALAAAGFDKSAMQVTKDQTTLGNPAESIQFSVFWAGECLIGQVGPETGDPVAVVLPAIEESHCLIGETRLIDW